MKPSLLRTIGISAFTLGIAAVLQAQPQSNLHLRPPSTPLIVHDPYFSIWSNSDRLTGGTTRHWTGTRQELAGIIRIDGKNYGYLGEPYDDLPALEETQRTITPTRTIITLGNEQIEVEICFFTPAFAEDMAIMARPVTYLSWQIKSRDGSQHDVILYLDVDGSVATNTSGEKVVWSHDRIDGLDLLRVGTQKQEMLQEYGDDLRINWGYFYLGVPDGQGRMVTTAGNWSDRQNFVKNGKIPVQDDLEQPRMPKSQHPASPKLIVTMPLGNVGSAPVTRHVLVSYDDIYSVEYMRQRLLPYWRKQFSTFAEMLATAERDYPSLTKRAEQFDAELEHDLVQEGGAEYASIAILAYRQAIGAHKLVEDDSGVPFFMPKENFSNGSISTVDVLYPSAPMFLLLNPKLVEAQLEPVMRYAETSHWKFPFAPHDLGVYPLANGQLYGGGESSEENQMPVEESGNMILMIAALTDAEHDASFAKRHWPLVTKWADFLLAKGFDPEKQLCTDDFAGHLAHNTNLSIKAIEALAAYAKVARKLGDEAAAKKYESAAKSMAAKWGSMALDGDHYRLAFDKSGTWSQKYNLVWDSILGLHMFAPEIAQREVAFYKTHLNPFGLPLDNRAAYTKLDWTIWSATLASSPDDFNALVSPIFHFLDKTPERIPMTDWYDTISAKHPGFQARSVVGGVYIKMLADPQMWGKWASRSNAQH
jgi:glutaminase A-like protein/uncharacterized protein DUF5127/uncharacterized protein DUF4964